MARSFKLLTARIAKDIDKKIRETSGISTLVLMENAGSAVACQALEMLGGRKRVAIFCGRGNNGGDGFVAARHLLAAGLKPHIFLAGEIGGVKNESRINLDILLKLKQKITEARIDNLCRIKNRVFGYDLIIDALLGVGLEGEVRGLCRDLIDIVNLSKTRVLSVDIPSGLDATTGRVLGCCVKAARTVTFIAPKRGLVIGQGRDYCGKVVVASLGI